MQLVDFLHDTQGFFTREQARESGYSDTQIAAAVRAGHWVRFRRGYYAYGADWRALDEVGRHRVRSRAVLHSLGPAVALSHVSATIEYGMVAWGHRLDRVHVTRLDGGAGRVEGDVVHHEGRCLADDVHELHGLRLMGPGRSAIEAASVVRNEVALCTLDSVLHLGLADHDQLMSTFVHMRHWPRTRHLHFPVRLAHAGSDGAWRVAWQVALLEPRDPATPHPVRGVRRRRRPARDLRLGMARSRVAWGVRRPGEVRATVGARPRCRRRRLRGEEA